MKKQPQTNRRCILMKILMFVIVAAACWISSSESATGTDCTADVDKKLQWRLGPAAWSFRFFSFFESVDKTRALELDYIEAFEGQRISKDSPKKLSRDLPDETIQQIRRKLDDAKVKLTGIYMSVPGDEAGCRKVFEFARKLGAGTIISEPDPKDLDNIEKFCDEYGINLALHNHPEGKSKYWHPREIIKICEGRSKRIGACADLGHWQRSGIKPAEGIRMLGKRIVSFHVKDLNEFGTLEAHDVPWGTGGGELEETFEEIRLLLNYQTEGKTLISLFLVGQPELGLKVDINKPLSQRLAMRAHLAPFTEENTADYIRHRLTTAGAQKELFTQKAYELAHDLSGGIPRRINNICNLALLLGASRQLDEIDEMVIYDVSRTLEGEY